MPDIILILSDLHLANGQSILDGFGDIQQAAFEGLTSAACGAGPMGHADEVELVINGDCFDFLVTAPYDTGGVSDVSTSLEKLQKIIAAHPSFFEALRSFIETPGRHVTFMTGNHDIELRFEKVRELIYTAIKYAYFDRFEPSMNSMRQIALLCLLDPAIIIETAQLTMDMFSEPRKALAGLAPGEERIAARLFEETMIDFAAFQQEMQFHKPDWVEPAGLSTEQMQVTTMIEFDMIRDALKLPLIEAVAAICTPTTYVMAERVAAGLQAVLKNDPALRYAFAGHTHMVRIDPVNNGRQSYLNTASWTMRLALPAPGEVNAELIEWFRRPDWEHVLLPDETQFTFAMVNSTPDGASSASLCVWEGGLKGSYRVLA